MGGRNGGALFFPVVEEGGVAFAIVVFLEKGGGFLGDFVYEGEGFTGDFFGEMGGGGEVFECLFSLFFFLLLGDLYVVGVVEGGGF